MNIGRKIIVILLFVMQHSQATFAQVAEHIKTLSIEGYIFPSNHLVAGIFPITNGVDLNTSQIIKAENILRKYFPDIKNQCRNINRCTLKKYKRQYWGTVNEKGHVLVNIYLISSNLTEQINIDDDIINIQDGGCDVILIIVDLEGNSFNIRVNGIA